MKVSSKSWYYFSLACIVFSLGAIIYGFVSGQIAVLGKFVLLLGIGIYFLIKERKARKEAATGKIESKGRDS